MNHDRDDDRSTGHNDEHDDEHDDDANDDLDAPESDLEVRDGSSIEDGAASTRTDPADRFPGSALGIALATTALVAVAQHFAFRPESVLGNTTLAPLALVYVPLAVLAIARLAARRETWLLRPRGGDLSLGAVVAVVVYGLGWVVEQLVCSPDSPRHGWILRVYLALGDPRSDARHLVALAAATIGLMEELVWRGLVTPTLERRFLRGVGALGEGALRAKLLAGVGGSVLFAAAHLPTAFALADPLAGPNPLLVAAALGSGLVWSYLRARVERLAPVLLSHAIFTWMALEFPLFALGR